MSLKRQQHLPYEGRQRGPAVIRPALHLLNFSSEDVRAADQQVCDVLHTLTVNGCGMEIALVSFENGGAKGAVEEEEEATMPRRAAGTRWMCLSRASFKTGLGEDYGKELNTRGSPPPHHHHPPHQQHHHQAAELVENQRHEQHPSAAARTPWMRF
ncbi:hypothetical protein GBF38_001237 [Nibea albiflora]|uniref:Uncharacterized protein n=1 Tax=Nibea albiflora TaxID=240163 RepID=A0ACB7EUB4_NIBAL|nr:hypothetical protein GBF38_001237 [Nibea albiflora]